VTYLRHSDAAFANLPWLRNGLLSLSIIVSLVSLQTKPRTSVWATFAFFLNIVATGPLIDLISLRAICDFQPIQGYADTKETPHVRHLPESYGITSKLYCPCPPQLL